MHYRPRKRRFSLCRHSMNVETSNPVAPPGAVSPSMTLIAVGSPDTDADYHRGLTGPQPAGYYSSNLPSINVLQAAKTPNLRGMSMSFQRGPEQLATHRQPFQGLTFPLFTCCSAREPRSGLEACTSTPDQRAVRPKCADSGSAVSLIMIIFTAAMTMS